MVTCVFHFVDLYISVQYLKCIVLCYYNIMHTSQLVISV